MGVKGRKNGMAIIALLFLSGILYPLTAQDLLTMGKEAFLNNQPQEAITYLSSALEVKAGMKEHYLYLGIAYQQVGEYSRAVETFSRGIENTPPPHAKFYFNMGNNYFAAGNSEGAEQAYSRAVAQDERFNAAYLNRANTRMRMERYDEAVQDYKLYLLRVPEDSQRSVIEELIRRVEAFRVDEEQRKREEEERRRAEEERQKALLQSVLDSLQNAEDDTVNLRADSEDVEGFDMELDIED